MFFEYSDMQGFVGGAMARIDDEIILFGDVNKLLKISIGCSGIIWYFVPPCR